MREIGAFILSLSEETALDDAKMIFEFGKRRWAYRDGTQWFLAENAKVILCSSAWDDDKREIWEILEARRLFCYVAIKSCLNWKEMEDLFHHETYTLVRACMAIEVGFYVNTINTDGTTNSRILN